MAWIDDRLYCHPKLMAVSKAARWIYVAAIAYSSGWETHGILQKGEQQIIGVTPKTRSELFAARLWVARPNGAVEIHDWNEHNDKRDERRKLDRERKREARASQRAAAASAGQSTGQGADKPADRRTLKEVKEVKEEKNPSGSSEVDLKAGLVLGSARDEILPDSQTLHDPSDPIAALIHELRDTDAGTELILRKLALPEYAYRQAIEEVTANGRKTALAISILHRIRDEITTARTAITEALPDDWLPTDEPEHHDIPHALLAETG